MRIRLSQTMNGQPLYWAAAYLVDGLLIDTGPRHTAEELVEFLEGQHVKLAVNTHYHEDHIGANRLIQQRLGLEIYAHPESIPYIERIPELPPYREFIWGVPEPSNVLPVPRRIRTNRFVFDVVEPPGTRRDTWHWWNERWAGAFQETSSFRKNRRLHTLEVVSETR